MAGLARLRRTVPLLLLVACGTEVAVELPAVHGNAIVGGSTDMLHDGVVALVDRAGRLRCSGTVIHERVVLTAAHCLTGADVSWLQIGFGVDGADATVEVKEEHAHPGWPTDRAHDIALLGLAEPVPTSVSVHRYADSLSDPSALGLDVEVVGYGREDSATGGSGTRRRGDARITIVAELELAFDPTPSSICYGDSGGPTFASVGAGDDVIGVHSRTLDSQCEMRGFDTRVAPYAADFIRPYLRLAEDQRPLGASCTLSVECEGRLRCEQGTCGSCGSECDGQRTPRSCDCRASPLPGVMLAALVWLARRRR